MMYAEGVLAPAFHLYPASSRKMGYFRLMAFEFYNFTHGVIMPASGRAYSIKEVC